MRNAKRDGFICGAYFKLCFPRENMLESAGGLCDGFSLFINIIIIIIITARPAPRSEPLSQPRGEGGKVRLGNK